MSKTAGNKPEACLACSDEHVAKFVLLAIKTPDWANTVGDVIAEKVSNEVILSLKTSGKNYYLIDQKGNILIISKIDPFTIGVHITNFHDSQLVEILVYIIAVLKNYLLLFKITYESGIREA